MAVQFRGQETNLAETETQNMPKTGNSLCETRFMEINRREQRGLSRLKAGNLSSDPGGDVESSQIRDQDVRRRWLPQRDKFLTFLTLPPG